MTVSRGEIIKSWWDFLISERTNEDKKIFDARMRELLEPLRNKCEDWRAGRDEFFYIQWHDTKQDERTAHGPFWATILDIKEPRAPLTIILYFYNPLDIEFHFEGQPNQTYIM